MNRLGEIGLYLLDRFERTGDVTDIDNAILYHERAVRLLPKGNSDKHQHLNNLGRSFLCRFTRSGELVDVEEAISTFKDAVRLSPDRHSAKPLYFSNLGSSFLGRFERSGELVDIEEAISAHKDAVRLTPDGQSDKPLYYNNLGNSFLRRFERSGELVDIEAAISAHKDAVRLTPEGHPDKPGCLNNLGMSSSRRFERSGELVDIEEAISAHKDAVRLTPDGHAGKPGRISNLGNSFSSRFERSGELVDIDEAISAHKDAIRLTPDGHSLKPMWLANLGASFSRRFECSGELVDIEQAISAHKHAVRFTPDSHADKPGRLANLGKSFAYRFEHFRDHHDLDNAIAHYRLSAISSTGPPLTRFSSALCWARLSPATSLDGYSVAISLIPRVAWLGHTISQRHRELQSISGFGNEAAGAAIALGKLDIALEWLEQARAVVWGQLLNLRTPVDELHTIRPELALDLIRVSKELDSAGTRDLYSMPESSYQHASGSLEQAAKRQYQVAERWETLLTQVRDVPGFEDFLRPKTLAQLLKAAQFGPVVYINVHKSRCDALILTPGHNEVILVPLERLSHDRALKLRDSLRSSLLAGNIRMRETRASSAVVLPGASSGFVGILFKLWEMIAKPVLDSLALHVSHSFHYH